MIKVPCSVAVQSPDVRCLYRLTISFILSPGCSLYNALLHLPSLRLETVYLLRTFPNIPVSPMSSVVCPLYPLRYVWWAQADIEARRPQCERPAQTARMLTMAGNRGPMVVMAKGVNEVSDTFRLEMNIIISYILIDLYICSIDHFSCRDFLCSLD